MNESKKYTFDGVELTIPLRRDDRTGIYIEDYREWIEKVVFTPAGHPIMFAGEDACGLAEYDEGGKCPDCGSCRFYRRADDHTWIGACMNEERRRKD